MPPRLYTRRNYAKNFGISRFGLGIFHLFPYFIVSTIRVGTELSRFGFDELLDKLGNRDACDILDAFCDDFPASCDRTEHDIFRCAASEFTGFRDLFILGFLAFATDTKNETTIFFAVIRSISQGALRNEHRTPQRKSTFSYPYCIA